MLTILKQIIAGSMLVWVRFVRVDDIFLWVIVIFIVPGFCFGSSLYWSISSDWSTWRTSWLCICSWGNILCLFNVTSNDISSISQRSSLFIKKNKFYRKGLSSTSHHGRESNSCTLNLISTFLLYYRIVRHFVV